MSARITTAKQFLAEIEKGFVKNEREGTSTFLTNLILAKYKGKKKKTRIRKLQIQYLKRNNKRNRMIEKLLVVSFTKLKSMVWFVLMLI